MEPHLPDKTTKPAFFQFSDNTSRSRGNPQARYITHPSDKWIWELHRAETYLRKDMKHPVAYISEAGSKWPDMVGSVSGPFGFMVTERVLEAMRAAEITGFKAMPVEIVKIESRKLRDVPPPAYFALEITGRMDFDLEAGEQEYNFGIRTSTRKFPLVDTWDGSDLFVMGNRETGYRFCTEKVLLLAREERWTNFRFVPIDVFSCLNISWKKGIDYLGRKWPPARWYPPRLSEGKTLDEWLDVYASVTTGEDWYDAYSAVLDVFDVDKALPAIIERCRSAKKSERGRWTRLLDELWRASYGPALPLDILEAIDQAGPRS